jgi:cytoskeleton protein RodZ
MSRKKRRGGGRSQREPGIAGGAPARGPLGPAEVEVREGSDAPTEAPAREMADAAADEPVPFASVGSGEGAVRPTAEAAGRPSSVAAETAGPAIEPIGAKGSLGERLRAAREARAMTREALSRQARLPLSVVAAIEADDFAALGAPIFARGFLRTYARTVGVPEIVVDAAQRALASEPPPLVVVNPPGVGDRLAARYKNPLVYALLTLVVIVPLVFLATPRTERVPSAAFQPLDATTSDAREPAANGSPPAASPASRPPAPPAPVMASMAPIAAATSTNGPPRLPGERVLRLEVREASWVELVTGDGRRLEYAQLPAGTVREYTFVGTADLVVGNTPGVSATLNGAAIDLNVAANRNVARLRLGDPAAEPRS